MTVRSRCVAVVPIFLALFVQSLLAAPSTAPSQSEFLRFVDKGSTGSKLETADVAYRNADGATVHLVAAVHVGEREYYQGLNQNFKLRDAVLYEMVKPRDAQMPKNADEKMQTHSGVSDIQRMMKDMLGLEFQLDVVDYSASNFVHADLDAETFEKMQAERGESFMTLFLQQFMKALTNPPENDKATAQDTAPATLDQSLEDMIKIFTRPDMERQIKLRLARQMIDMEGGPMGSNALNGTVLLTERNKAAIAALDTALKNGKKDVAIFYGAAHMPELSQLLAQRGFKPIATEWRMAWDLTIRPDAPSAVEKALTEMLKGLSEDEDDNADPNRPK